jgi:ectoine hydroxylase-related dioxygenase (phytanoyl-CoA dioxygenase family)
MNSASAVQESRTSSGSFDENGFRIISDALSPTGCDLLAVELSELFERQQAATRNRIGGVRNLLRLSARVMGLATSPRILSLVDQATMRRGFPVRAIFFDKTPETNWRVPWHQDLTIAVAERIETDGFGPWSIKDGVVHVQPPISILERMVAIRLHLDDCHARNGALRVVPGSHHRGEISSAEIARLTRMGLDVTCEVARGGVLVMRPLLLHASSVAIQPSHRRVLHIEYACDELPNGLQWFDR